MRKRNCLVTTAIVAIAAVALATTALPAAAQSAEVYVEAAREVSPSVQARQSAVRRAEALYAELTDPSLFTYQLGTGAMRATFTEEGSNTLDIAPEATVELAAPWGTSLGVSLGTTLTFGDPVDGEFSPSVSLTQPLSELIFDLPDSVAEGERYNAMIQARVALRDERARVETQVYSALQTLSQRGHDLRSAERDLRLAQDDVAEARELGTYAESSAQFQNLLLEIRLAEESVAYAEQMVELQNQRVERLTGIYPDGVPDAPAWRDAPDVSEVDPRSTTTVQLALLSLDLEELRYTQEYGKLPPSLLVEGRAISREAAAGSPASNSGAGSGTAERVMDYQTTLTAAWDDLSLSAGGGVTPDQNTYYVTAELRWAPGTASTDESGRAAQSEAVRQAALNVEESALSVEESLASYRGDFAEQNQRYAELEERLDYARLQLEETRTRADRGLADADAVEAAEWSIAAIEHERALLAWSRRIRNTAYAQMVKENI